MAHTGLIASFAFGTLSLCFAACHDPEMPALDDAGSMSEVGDSGATPRDDAAAPPPERDAQTTPAAMDAEAGLAHAEAGSLDDAGSLPRDDGATAPPTMDAEAGTLPANDATTSVPSDAGDAQTPGQPALISVKQLALGRAHGCSLDPAISGLLCWGDNQRGQTTLPTLSNPRFVATGGDVTCAIDDSGVKCWGDKSHKQLNVPAALGPTAQLAVGDAHVCALSKAGAVRCWGDDSFAQLTVPTLREVRSIGAGMRHTCALTADGVRCWGDNTLGQRDVPALTNPVQLTVGGFHSCAIDGANVKCWGGGNAALLQGIPTLNGPKIIAAGRSHSCALDTAGAHCWGDPAAGNLAPRELTNVQQLAVGGTERVAHACARHQQGVVCWGDNSLGQTNYDGRPLHIVYRGESNIAAPPALVWSVLMDLDNYGLWNPYTIAMKSTLKVGDPMMMTVKMDETVTIEQTENIRVLDGRKVCWGIDTTTPELNSGERCQWLEPLPDGGTHYVTEDLIEGTLNPLVLALFGEDTRVGFLGVASGLKTRAEALNKP